MEARMASVHAFDVHDDCTACVRTPASFCDLSQASRAALNAAAFPALYPAGAVLFGEGDLPRGVFIVCSGRAKVLTSSAEGKTLIVRIAGPGEVLGVSATVNGKPYEVSAETLDPSQLSFVKRNDFLRLLNGNAEMALNAVRQLSAKYHAAQREIRSLGLANTTAEKLAHLLLDWCGSRDAVHIAFTHEEIAQMIGSTRETVTRVLSDFRHGSLIEVNGANIVLLNRAALAAMITT
jgi:CRP/FNR family transcriptional regulator